MRRAMRIMGWLAGILVGMVVLAIGLGYLFLTSDDFPHYVERTAGTYSGRKTKIEKISIDWGATTRVHLRNLEVANADWAKEPHMLKAQEVDIDLRLWPLVKGDLIVPRLVLRKPEIAVESGEQDQLNWSRQEATVASEAAAEAVEPDSRFEAPLVGRLEITDGRITYRNTKRQLELDGTIATAEGTASDQPTAEFQLKGSLEDQPLSVRLVAGSVLMLRETEQPYPVDLDVTYGRTKLEIKGTLQDPFKWAGANLTLSLIGPDLADVYPLLGIPGPPTPPYRISGKLDYEAGLWKLDGSKWRVGESDIAGDVIIDQRKKPRSLTAKLVSQKLVVADLAPLVGAAPDRPRKVTPQQRQAQRQLEARGDLFPNAPLRLERLRAMNMDVTLDARRVEAPDYLPVQAISLRLVVDNGRATVRPLTMAMAGGGKVTGELLIDAQVDTPKMRTTLKATNIEFGTFFRNSRYFETTHGRIRGQVSLSGQGRSLAQIMSVANGRIDVAMAGGSVSSLMVSLAGLQIVDALVLYVTGDNRIPILCALGRLNFRNGVATFDKTLLDTRKSVLRVDGQIALPVQTVKAEVSADPKSFDLLDLYGPVVIEGKIRSPAVRISRPVPRPVFGDAKNVACQALTRQLFSGR